MPEVPPTGLLLIASDAGLTAQELIDYIEGNGSRTIRSELVEQIQHAALQQIWAYQALWRAVALTQDNDDILEFYEGATGGIDVAFNGETTHKNLSMDQAWKVAEQFGGMQRNPDDERTYAVWQFSGADGYEEESGLSLEAARAAADALHQRTGRTVRVFDEDKLAEDPWKQPRATYTASKRLKRNGGGIPAYAPSVDRNGRDLHPGDRVRFKTYPRGTAEGIVAVSDRVREVMPDGSTLPALVIDVEGNLYGMPSGRGVLKLKGSAHK